MLSEYCGGLFQKIHAQDVLILVLMEYALWARNKEIIVKPWKCLNPCFNGICSLRIDKFYATKNAKDVLILVLMEYALWELLSLWDCHGIACLNPCFNGICSLRIFVKIWQKLFRPCLNPCFNGICSLRAIEFPSYDDVIVVLILVLMEYALWDIPSVSPNKEGYMS